MRHIILILLFSLLPLSAQIAIAEGAQPIFDLKSDESIKASLKQLVGKQVTLRVVNGEDIKGTVKEVGKDSVYIASLTGQEFYDALVQIDEIVAITARSR